MENNALQLLAEKLGVASEYVFTTLVKQAPIESTITLIQYIIVWVLSYIFVKYHIKFSEENENGYSKYDSNDNLGITMFILALTLGLFNIIAFLCISDILNGYFNPEYWALNKILNTIKN